MCLLAQLEPLAWGQTQRFDLSLCAQSVPIPGSILWEICPWLWGATPLQRKGRVGVEQIPSWLWGLSQCLYPLRDQQGLSCLPHTPS